jgi:hypothetical protein
VTLGSCVSDSNFFPIKPNLTIAHSKLQCWNEMQAKFQQPN